MQELGPYGEERAKWWHYFVSCFVVNIIGGLFKHVVPNPFTNWIGNLLLFLSFLLFWAGVFSLVRHLKTKKK